MGPSIFVGILVDQRERDGERFEHYKGRLGLVGALLERAGLLVFG